MDAYTKRSVTGLCRTAYRLASVACVAGIALAAAGCSTSFQLGDMAKGGAPETTQSAAAFAPVSPARRASAEASTEVDLAIAKAAAADLLARSAGDVSQPWENPRTGARGTVTPIGSTYAQSSGGTCRDFLASHVRGSLETWYQGGACRKGARWEVRELRPLRRS